MRALVQRVRTARVEVDDQVVGEIGHGLVCFLGIGRNDGEADVPRMADRVAGLRVFEDEAGKMSRALADVGGGLLVVSQFTLYGDTTRGRRPSFEAAMPPTEAERLYRLFVEEARTRVPRVATGQFGAMMRVLVDNDGPVTLMLESRA